MAEFGQQLRTLAGTSPNEEEYPSLEARRLPTSQTSPYTEPPKSDDWLHKIYRFYAKDPSAVLPSPGMIGALPEALPMLLGTNTGLGLAMSGMGGPEGMTLREAGPAILQTLLAPFTSPSSTQGVIYPLYHGTTKGFAEHDPSLTQDIGMHFGTLEQAQNRIAGPGTFADYAAGKPRVPTYYRGGNIRPVNVDIENPARLRDLFSRVGSMKMMARDILDSDYYARRMDASEPGLKFSPENEKALMDAASRFDSGQGGHQALKDFWKVVQKQATESGHDGIVYRNEVEGAGDSYIVFDPKKITPRFGPSPSQLAGTKSQAAQSAARQLSPYEEWFEKTLKYAKPQYVEGDPWGTPWHEAPSEGLIQNTFLDTLDKHGIQHQIRGGKLNVLNEYTSPSGQVRKQWVDVSRMTKTELMKWLGY